jgi:trigger factor
LQKTCPKIGAYLQQQCAGQVRQEVLGDALQKTFGEAVKQQKLRVAGYPRFEAKPSEANDNFEFSATFEIYPEIELGTLENVTIERPTVVPGEPEVDKTIEILRKQRVRYQAVDRGAQMGDRITIDYRGIHDGQEFEGGSGNDHVTVLGEGRLLADFEQRVLGLTAGQSRAFELTFPEDHRGKELAGKVAQFDLTSSRWRS